jgi:hypothetical protein
MKAGEVIDKCYVDFGIYYSGYATKSFGWVEGKAVYNLCLI